MYIHLHSLYYIILHYITLLHYVTSWPGPYTHTFMYTYVNNSVSIYVASTIPMSHGRGSGHQLDPVVSAHGDGRVTWMQLGVLPQPW